MKQKKILLDTSVVINGFISKMLESGEISEAQVIVPRAVIAELQNQASRGLQGALRVKKDKGYM
jgi:ATPase